MAATAEAQLTYTQHIDFLEAVFSQAAAGDYQATAGGYASLRSVRATVARLLEVAAEKQQEDRIERLRKFEEQLEGLVAKLESSYGVTDEADVFLFRGASLKAQQTKLTDSLPSSADPSSPSSTAIAEVSVAATSSGSVYASAMFSCPVCYEDVSFDSTRSVISCADNHLVCSECMRNAFTSLILSNESHRLSCLYPECQAVASDEDVSNVVIPEIFDRYLGQVVLAVIKRESNFRFCPNPVCSLPVILEDECRAVQLFTCPYCSVPFCGACGRDAHPESSCDGVPATEPEQLFQAWLISRNSKVKSCPHCKTLTEKNGGCNHMTCMKCHAGWCWLCQKNYDSSHYASGPCEGLQFVGANSLEEHLAARARQAAMDNLPIEERTRIAREELNAALFARRQVVEAAIAAHPVVPVHLQINH